MSIGERGLYQHVSQAERERRVDDIFFSHLSEMNLTMMGVEKKQDEIDKQINALPSYLKPWYQSSKPKPPVATMTAPRQSLRNWIEELPRWMPNALRASALITAALYGVSL